MNTKRDEPGCACIGRAALLAVAVLTAGTLRAEEGAPQPAPDPQWILERARNSYAMQDYELHGSLRQGYARTPFRLTMQNGMIRFQFAEPDQIIHLEMRDHGYLLREVVAGRDALVEKSRYGEAVRGTDLTYEDLSMRFLYWPQAEYLGEEKIKTAQCWKVHVKNPDGTGPYSHVVLWVDQASGGLAQIMGLDRNGQLVRRFLVTKVQKIEGAWMLEEMRVERYDVASGKVAGRTYLEISDPGGGKAGGGTFKKR